MGENVKQPLHKQVLYGCLGAAISLGIAFVLLAVAAAVLLSKMSEWETMSLDQESGSVAAGSATVSAREIRGSYDMDSTGTNMTYYVAPEDIAILVQGFEEVVVREERIRWATRFPRGALKAETRVFVRSEEDSLGDERDAVLLVDDQSGFVRYSDRRRSVVYFSE